MCSKIVPRIFGESETVRSTCPKVISNSYSGISGRISPVHIGRLKEACTVWQTLSCPMIPDLVEYFQAVHKMFCIRNRIEIQIPQLYIK